MPTNQKYSARIHSKRQLSSAGEHVRLASDALVSVGSRYEEALPQVSQACDKLNDMMVMAESMISDVKDII